MTPSLNMYCVTDSIIGVQCKLTDSILHPSHISSFSKFTLHPALKLAIIFSIFKLIHIRWSNLRVSQCSFSSIVILSTLSYPLSMLSTLPPRSSFLFSNFVSVFTVAYFQFTIKELILH